MENLVPAVVACPGCGKRLKVPVARAGGTARCPSCHASIPLPGARAAPAAPVAPPAEAPESGRAVMPFLTGMLLVLLGAATVPLAFFSDALVAIAQDYPLPTFGPLGILLLVPVGLGLLVAGIGLLARQSWAWMLALVCVLCGAAYYAKLVLPVFLHLRWEHREAARIARAVGVFEGVPLLFFLVVLGLLFVPSVRRAGAAPSRRRARERALRSGE